MLGGATTNLVGNQSSSGFDTPAPNLLDDALALHLAGDSEFERAFTKAPSADFPTIDGLGPAFNNNACLACHVRDGRANYPAGTLSDTSGEWSKLGADAGVFLRISVEGPSACEPVEANDYCAPVAVPGFSKQLFHRGVLGLREDAPFTGQADVYVRFETEQVAHDDGSVVTLRRPVFQVRNPYDSPGEVQPATGAGAGGSRLFQTDVRFSPRIGLPVFGSGLLEAIPESAILALADPEDVDGDGISGRPNWVPDPVLRSQGASNSRALGRFGWKAGTPSVQVQGSGAYQGDMGITSYLFPNESIAGTPLLAAYQSRNPGDDGQAGSGHEVSEAVLKAVMFYTNTLAVPARRRVDDAKVSRGAGLFDSTGCTSCHVPSFVTGNHRGVWGPQGTIAVPQVENQTIHPFTDLLLHDMGAGLADGRTEFSANGREWRTRPLWGIGLTHTVNALAGFLHDGRAATLEEAVLWHGGEAEQAQLKFRALTRADREALLAFLASL